MELYATRHSPPPRPSPLFSLLTLCLLTVPAQAEKTGLLSQGRMSFGLSGGFGNGSVSIGGGYGYFVIDQLQPAISVSYSYASGDLADSHQVRTGLELLYYIVETDWISPFVGVDGAHLYLAYRGAAFEEDHHFFYAGGSVGALVILGGSVGLTLGMGVGTWLGADQSLYDRKLLKEGVIFSGRFGLSVIY